MEKETRGAIQSATQRARRLLEEDFREQLEGDHDIMADGHVAVRGGPHLSARQQTLRDRMVAAIDHKRSTGMKPVEAVADFLRDSAFTTLNRFVALKMLEARGLVQECVTRGDASSGFAELCGLAPALRLPDGSGYRLYLECVFDELSTEVKVLFDRRDPAAVLWPRRPTLDALLAVLNAPDLASVWGEDETIGWVYQYFNGQDERRKMREESQAPRNSRELAVRNQFFTPRYVVEFLVDNTLGRMWLEMRDGISRLADRCEYLVRPETEDFRSRPAKDPRDLRILDPACGSGHFLLHAFDLLVDIYEEAWAGPGEAPRSHATGRTIREDYPSLAELHRELPTLVLEQNLHGIDIDPRCTQIAALALWLRAQRAWGDHGIRAADRPRVRRTHIVVAEPIPGDRHLVDEFATQLEPPLLRDLFRKMVGETRLAGELGALLRVEDAIAEDLRRAREMFAQQRQPSGFLPGFEPQQQQRTMDFSGIDDDEFFQKAEVRIAAALHVFAETAIGGTGTRRRLFADDAAQGVALIDLLRGHFDVILMNPPFGAGSLAAKAVFERAYPRTKNDIYAAFVERGVQLLKPRGLLGAITSRTGFFLSSFQRWREEVLLNEAPPVVFADLGYGVLDSAMVEVAAYCLEQGSGVGGINTVFLRALEASDKPSALVDASRNSAMARRNGRRFELNARDFAGIPKSPFAYWANKDFLNVFERLPELQSHGRIAASGGKTLDDFRWIRSTWEIPPRRRSDWPGLAKGGGFSAHYADVHLLLDWRADARSLKAYLVEYRVCRGWSAHWSAELHSSEHYLRPGLTWPIRTQSGLSFRVMPAGCIFANKGPAIFVEYDDSNYLMALLAIGNSAVFRALVDMQMAFGSFEVGVIQRTPVPHLTFEATRSLAALSRRAWSLKRGLETSAETSHAFLRPAVLEGAGDLASSAEAWAARVRATQTELLSIQTEINEFCWKIYGIGETARRAVTTDFGADTDIIASAEINDTEDEAAEENEADASTDPRALTADLVSWAVGVAFGRFDVRLATRFASQPVEPEPFEALPVCSPAMLVDQGKLPLNRAPPDYPFDFPERGILVDDPGHPHDLTTAVRAVFSEVFGQAAEARWDEATHLLATGTQGLRFWLNDAYFEHHLKRYSKSRRKAPVLWQLGIPSGQYSVWLYSHRLARDSLFELQNDVIAPKLAHEERQLQGLRMDVGSDASATKRREVEAAERLVEELRAMLEDVRRVAPLWNPSLEDGVVLTMAPLWRLVPQHKLWQRELTVRWDELATGKHEWAHIAMHLWPERVVPKCAADRSLAIGHGLEDALWVEDLYGRWRRRTAVDATIRYLEDNLPSERLRDTTDELRCFSQQHVARQTEHGWWEDLKSGRHDDTKLALALWPERVLRKARAQPSMLDGLGLQVPTRGFDDRALEALLKRHKPRLTKDELAVLDEFCAHFADAAAWQARWADFDAGRMDEQPLARFLHSGRVVAKALDDHSFAVGHDLARWFWLDTQDDPRRLKAPDEEVAVAIAEREKPAVKAALKALLEAPTAAGPARRQRGARSA